MKLFGCAHERISWVRGKQPDTYIVCLDCGKEFPYDWERMEVRPEPERKRA